MRICVFCSSSNSIGKEYFNEADLLGEEMARRGHSLIYGGGDVGTMGAIAHALQDAGGHVIGVIPHALNELAGVGFKNADELIITETMRQRKAIMDENADAFVALPGGLGTFEELLEIITLKQLHYHSKAIVIMNSTGYYDPLLTLLEHAVAGRFMKDVTLDLFHVSESVTDAIEYIEAYKSTTAAAKWTLEAPSKQQAEVAVE